MVGSYSSCRRAPGVWQIVNAIVEQALPGNLDKGRDPAGGWRRRAAT